MPVEKLIFVYNANSGTLNALLDSAHKIVSPSTYQCSLCDLTHDTWKEKEEWVRFRESVITTNQVQELEFLHKDEFEKQYRSKWLPRYDYPVILQVNTAQLEIFMSNKELQQFSTTDRLIESITTKLNAL